MAGIFFVHSRLGGVVLVLLAFLSSSTSSAQVATGSIAGTVSDSTGQIVPGAQVTIREVNRNTTTTLVTDGSGVYTAPFLVPGTYEVQVELQGFKTWIRRGVILQVTDRVRVDVALEVGTIKEATTVVASAPVVRTDSSEAGTVIEEMAIKEIAGAFGITSIPTLVILDHGQVVDKQIGALPEPQLRSWLAAKLPTRA